MGHWLNNRAEKSHLPFQERRQEFLRFQWIKSPQKSPSVHANSHDRSNSESQPVDRQSYKDRRSAALAERQKPMT
jgi:putative transposase